MKPNSSQKKNKKDKSQFENLDVPNVMEKESVQADVSLYKSDLEIYRNSKVCSNCRASETPFWRKSQHTNNILCNACGLYEKTHGFSRKSKLFKGGKSKILTKRDFYNICILCEKPYSKITYTPLKDACGDCKLKYGNVNSSFFYEFSIKKENKQSLMSDNSEDDDNTFNSLGRGKY